MKREISRQEFERSVLLESDVSKDPFVQFSQWWQDAIRANATMVDAIHLATVDKDYHPNVRVVLLKDFDARGFVFFTNYDSAKAEELQATPYAAINAFWPELERQIRLRGKVERTSAEESLAYFASRPRGSQIGAWVSPQSKPINDRDELEKRYTEVEAQYHGKNIPCPKRWGGFRLVPSSFEFWQGRKNRLHDRFAFHLNNGIWRRTRLAP